MKPGATGRFPLGKVGPDDEGELAMALAVDRANGIVRVMFGKPVSWVGLYSPQLRELAQMLIEKANELDSRKS